MVEERIDVRLDLAASLLQAQPPQNVSVMPALWASFGLAASAIFLAGLMIMAPGNGRSGSDGPVLRATETAAVQTVDDGNASFQLSGSKDGLKGGVADVGAAAAGSEGAH